MLRIVASVAVSLFVTSLLATDPIRVSDASGFHRAVSAAKPGDKILVAPGDYANNFSFKGIRGSEKEPIVIAASDPKNPPRFIGKTAPLQFNGVSYLELKDLAFAGASGNGLNIDDAGDPDKPSHHVTLRNLYIQEIGPKGNSDGIKLSGVDDFTVVGCTIERWGSNGSGIDMVGCHRGVIEGCTFRKGGSNGVQTKGGSANVTIRKCQFEDAGERAVNIGGSTGNDYFRPRLKDFPKEGKYEAKNVCVEGCTITGSAAAIAFVGMDGAIVRFNTIYRPGRYAIRILQENNDSGFAPCRNGVFESNVVVFRSDAWVTGGVNIGGNTAPDTFTFAKNLWHCEDRPDRSKPKLPTNEKDQVTGKDPGFKAPAKGDFAVGPDSPANGRGAHALPPAKER